MADNNNDVVYGTDLILMIEVGGTWQQIAHAQSHGMDTTRETRQVSSKSTGEWMLSRYGKISWSGSVDGLVILESGVANYELLLDKQIAREQIKVISILNDATNETPLDDTNTAYDPTSTVDTGINPFKTGTPYYEGNAVITSMNKTAQEGDNVTFSMSFEGASKLEKKTVATVV